LVIDIDRRCTPKQTIRFVRAIEQKLDIAWVEGAARDRDFPVSKQVSDAIAARSPWVAVLQRPASSCPLPSSLGRRHPGRHRCHGNHRCAPARGCRIRLELPVMLVAAPGNMHAHLAAVMPYFMSVEVVDPRLSAALQHRRSHRAGLRGRRS
jgi:hypothetical protein